MVDNSTPLSSEKKGSHELRSHPPTPYNLQRLSVIPPQLRKKTDWNRSTMDPLIEYDTRSMRVDLKMFHSRALLEFLYPDRLLFPKRGSTIGEHHTMDQILLQFKERGWYKPGRKTRGIWLPPSGCPPLAPKYIKDCEEDIEKFLNNILGFVGDSCSATFFRWDASSSNYPLEGSAARRKPDITCYFDAASGRSHHWGRVATFAEVKNRNTPAKQRASFTEIGGKTSCMLGVQDGRHLVPCIRFLGSSVSLTIFDRGGSISTSTFDIHTSPKEFLRIVLGVSLADYSSLGFDISIQWDGRIVHPDDKIEPDDETPTQDRGDQTRTKERSGLDRDEGCSGEEDEEDENEDDEDEDENEEDEDENEEDEEDEDYQEDVESDRRHKESDWHEMEYQQPASESDPPRRKWLEIVDKEGRICKIWLQKILSISDSLAGRGSTVWEGVVDGLGMEETVAVKDSWIDPLRKYTEGMILHILESCGIEGVPELVAEHQVKAQRSADDATEVNHSTHFLRSKLGKYFSPKQYHLRVLARLVTRPVGSLIAEFSSLGELLVAFLDCVIAHKDAVEIARILHRDISLVNLLLATVRLKKRTAHEKYIKRYVEGTAQRDLCKRISGLARRGVLADWGYAVPITPAPAPVPVKNHSKSPSPTGLESPTSPIDPSSQAEVRIPLNLVPVKTIGGGQEVTTILTQELTDDCDIVLQMGTDNPETDSRQTIDACPLYRTGTWSWMSAELVMADPGQPVTHGAIHDLESFFYVLVGICVLYSEPSKPKPDKELSQCYDKLFNTFRPSILKTIFIQSDLTWFPYVVKHISPYFQPLVPLLNDLRAAIILPMFTNAEGKFDRRTSFDHDTIIERVVSTLASLNSDAWGNAPSETPDVVTPQTPPEKSLKQAGDQFGSTLFLGHLGSTFPQQKAYSDSGIYLGQDARLLGRAQSSVQDYLNTRNLNMSDDTLPLLPTSSSLQPSKSAGKRPFPPPLIPVHATLKTTRSDSLLLMEPHDSGSGELPFGARKRTRLSGPNSSQSTAQDVAQPRRSLRKKSCS